MGAQLERRLALRGLRTLAVERPFLGADSTDRRNTF
jgi:hypothetical protein